MAAVINLDTVRLMRNIEETPLRQPKAAEIILFPGVRYERWDEDADARLKDKSASECDKRAISQD